MVKHGIFDYGPQKVRQNKRVRGEYPRLTWQPLLRAREPRGPDQCEQVARDFKVLVGRAEDVQVNVERAHVDGHLYNEDAAQDWLKQICQWEDETKPLDDELAETLDGFVEEIRAAAQLATKEAIAEQSKSWRKYVTDALSNGGKFGHAFLRASKGWVATAAVQINGVLKSDPQSLLAVQRDTWAAEWRADANGTAATVPRWWDELLEAAEKQQPLRMT